MTSAGNRREKPGRAPAYDDDTLGDHARELNSLWSRAAPHRLKPGLRTGTLPSHFVIVALVGAINGKTPVGFDRNCCGNRNAVNVQWSNMLRCGAGEFERGLHWFEQERGRAICQERLTVLAIARAALLVLRERCHEDLL